MIVQKFYKSYYERQLQIFKKEYPRVKIISATLFNLIKIKNKLYTLTLLIMTKKGDIYVFKRGFFEQNKFKLLLSNINGTGINKTPLGYTLNIDFKHTSIMCEYPEYGNIQETFKIINIQHILSKREITGNRIQRACRFTKLLLDASIRKLFVQFIYENKSIILTLTIFSAVLPEYIKEDLFEYFGITETNVDIAKNII
jgi:hypothetical protein